GGEAPQSLHPPARDFEPPLTTVQRHNKYDLVKATHHRGERRREIVDEIRKASEEWEFFRIVNHGVPFRLMDGMLNGIRRFHEQPEEAKKRTCIPQIVGKKELQDCAKCMVELREMMAELLSKALGLGRDYISGMECMKSEALACLYYRVCPEPELTFGTSKHSDTTFLTLLMQDTSVVSKSFTKSMD
ncbi:hypothetical protein RJ639_032645, partial [Escallonia herrerae]